MNTAVPVRNVTDDQKVAEVKGCLKEGHKDLDARYVLRAQTLARVRERWKELLSVSFGEVKNWREEGRS